MTSSNSDQQSLEPSRNSNTKAANITDSSNTTIHNAKIEHSSLDQTNYSLLNPDADLQPETLASTLKLLSHPHQYFISPQTRISLGPENNLSCCSSPIAGEISSILPEIIHNGNASDSNGNHVNGTANELLKIYPVKSSHENHYHYQTNLGVGSDNNNAALLIAPDSRGTNSHVSDDEDNASVPDDEFDFLQQQEEEEDTEDEVDSILNETGYADGQVIDERTEKAEDDGLDANKTEDLCYNGEKVTALERHLNEQGPGKYPFINDTHSDTCDLEHVQKLLQQSQESTAQYVLQQQDYYREPLTNIENSEYQSPTLPEDTTKYVHIKISHEDMLPAPENFSMVVNGIYRSSFPRVENFEFLKRIKLKSILVLIPEQYPEENLEFLKAHNIKIFQAGMPGNKEPFVHVPHATITQALSVAINPANHPILIHCNRGKHRTGCVVGCIRRLQNWSLTMIFDEYRRFAFPKARPLDQQLIELYNDEDIYEQAVNEGWIPFKWS